MGSKRRVILFGSILATSGVCAVVSAGHLFWSRTRVCDQGRVRIYQYADDKVVTSAFLDLVNRVTEPQVIASTNSLGQPITLRRKAYYGDLNTVTIGGLTATGITAQIRDNGLLSASCSLYFDGEVERALKGCNVTLRLIAYTGSSEIDREQMTMIWESAQSLWVPTNQIKTVSIVPTNRQATVHTRKLIYPWGGMKHDASAVLPIQGDRRSRPQEVFIRHFDEINLLQFVLERHTDR